MRNVVGIGGITILAVAVAAVIAGWYPVAVVDGAPILHRTWQKSRSAVTGFTNAQRHSVGMQPLDFSSSENSSILREIERDTLTFLIEDLIIQKEGRELHRAFEALSRERAAEALKRGGEDLSRAAEFVYGLSLQEFRELILYPQARIETAHEFLQESGLDFEAWLANAKKSAKVRLMFVPYSWDGEAIQ